MGLRTDTRHALACLQESCHLMTVFYIRLENQPAQQQQKRRRQSLTHWLKTTTPIAISPAPTNTAVHPSTLAARQTCGDATRWRPTGPSAISASNGREGGGGWVAISRDLRQSGFELGIWGLQPSETLPSECLQYNSEALCWRTCFDTAKKKGSSAYAPTYSTTTKIHLVQYSIIP